jgi:hypothetical protein
VGTAAEGDSNVERVRVVEFMTTTMPSATMRFL